jgi:hypothetical protein
MRIPAASANCLSRREASSPRHDWLTGLGADQLADHTTVAFDDVLADVDVVLDLVGDARDNTSTRSLTVLRPGG